MISEPRFCLWSTHPCWTEQRPPFTSPPHTALRFNSPALNRLWNRSWVCSLRTGGKPSVRCFPEHPPGLSLVVFGSLGYKIKSSVPCMFPVPSGGGCWQKGARGFAPHTVSAPSPAPPHSPDSSAETPAAPPGPPLHCRHRTHSESVWTQSTVTLNWFKSINRQRLFHFISVYKWLTIIRKPQSNIIIKTSQEFRNPNNNNQIVSQMFANFTHSHSQFGLLLWLIDLLNLIIRVYRVKNKRSHSSLENNQTKMRWKIWSDPLEQATSPEPLSQPQYRCHGLHQRLKRHSNVFKRTVCLAPDKQF